MVITSAIKPEVAMAIKEIKREQAKIRDHLWREVSESELPHALEDLNAQHLDAHKRAFALAVEQVGAGIDLGRIRFAAVLLGSGARGEQLFYSDQDHALVYDPGAVQAAETEEWTAYFSQVGLVYGALLHELGYPLCTGNVMMSNPRWRGTVGEWERRIDEYSGYPDWDSIRYLLIASDARAIIGDAGLVGLVRRQVAGCVARSPYICWKIADQGLADRAQGTVFPGWRDLADTSFSIKERLYNPLVNSVRLWALSIGIEDISSLSRIDQLYLKKAWTEELANEVKSALFVAIALRWRQQVKMGENAVEGANDAALRGQDREALNAALRTVRKLIQISTRHFPRPRR